MFELAYLDSMVLSRLDFWLFNDLKKDLPKDYLITIQDINLLAMLNGKWSIKGKKQTMQNILDWYHNLSEVEQKVLYQIHCDPFELFIDAWWIDTKLKIKLK